MMKRRDLFQEESSMTSWDMCVVIRDRTRNEENDPQKTKGIIIITRRGSVIVNRMDKTECSHRSRYAVATIMIHYHTIIATSKLFPTIAKVSSSSPAVFVC